MGVYSALKVSNHAMKRYAERIMGKEDGLDINRFVSTNEEKIKNDIEKLIDYGELIYTGTQCQKDGRRNPVDVFLKDAWVVLVDVRAMNVITLYKVNLGLDDEFNQLYISKMKNLLADNKENLRTTQETVQAEVAMYREMIADTEKQIKDYKSMIKNLEDLCAGYKMIVENSCVRIAQAEREVAETVNTLIQKKEF